MVLIKEYEGRGLKHIQYDCNDAEILRQTFKFSPGTILQLCRYLRDTNQVVDAIDTYDGQSNWQGVSFIIGEVDLSGNGFLLNNKRLTAFLIEKGY